MCDICRSNSTSIFTPSRRKFVLGTAAIGLVFAGPANAKAKRKEKEGEDDEKEKKKPPKPDNAISPDASLKRLMDGNARYVDGVARRHDFKHEREALSGGQNPYAGILSCADSRIAPEYAFDSGRGDLFVCRLAGNFANDDSVASLEYGVAVLGVPLILVLGHDACGAVDATIKSLKDDKPLPGHMPSLVAALAPAVKAVSQKGGDVLGNAIRQNVIDNVARLSSATPILSAAVEQKKLKVVGGIYRLKDGRVDMVA
jgi:carbonic anhydrase